MDTSRIIKGAVSNGRYTVTAPIVKEDYGLYLQIEGVELPETYQVDFSNSENSGTSVTMIGNADGVLIPSQFISTGKDVFAFLYHVGEDFGRTVYKFRIPNKVRPDRTNEEPTPEEQSVIDQCISALNEAVAQTAQDVIGADASAQSAQEYAEQAETAKTNAQTYANNAQTSANNASASASQASASATASAQSASDAETARQATTSLVAEAQGYADTSAQSASASANSASQAQGFAQSASASANSASGYASQADISANTASNKASEASTSASTASAKATESAQSASQALSYKTDAESAKTASQTAQGLAESARDSAITAKNDAESAKADAESARDEAQQAVASISGALADKAPVITDTASGAIASFSDGADDLPLKSLVVDINPIQDLHGQDTPYPAGGSANIWGIMYPVSTERGATVVERADGTFFVSCDVALGKLNYLLNVEANEAYTIKCELSDVTGNATQASIITVYDGEDETATILLNGVSSSASLKNFTPSGDKVYLKFNVTGGNAGGTAVIGKPTVIKGSYNTIPPYYPYENICPISGWTGANVTHCGKDLLAPTDYKGEYNGSSGTDLKTASPASYEYTNTGVIISASAWGGRLFATPPLPAGTYFVHSDAITGNPRCSLYITNSNLVVTSRIKNIGGSGERFNNSVTLTENGQRIAVEIMSSVSDNLLVPALQCEVGSVYTPYVPHIAPESIPISWQSEAGTVYGGKLDVLSGELVIDRAMVDLGTLTWAKNTETATVQDWRSSDIASLIKAVATNVTPNALCSQFSVMRRTAMDNVPNSIGVTSSGRIGINVPAGAYDSASAFKSAMSGVQLCYELAEPIEIQLSANQINSLYGVNNIWADSGDTEVEYRADTKLYIERLTAPDSADMIADANITNGQYFMVGNSLYKATANIANGGQIVVGTNCTRVSLAQALNEINA